MAHKYFDVFKSLFLTLLRLDQSRFCLGLIVYSSWVKSLLSTVPKARRIRGFFWWGWAPFLTWPESCFLFPLIPSKGNFPVAIGIPLGMLFANIWSSYIGLQVESVCVRQTDRQTRFQEARQRNENGRRREQSTASLIDAPQSPYTFKSCVSQWLILS